MKKAVSGVLAAAATLVFAGSARAQLIPNFTPFSFEARAGAALPQGDFGDEVDTGTTFGGSATFHFAPLLGIYGGYSQTSFGGDLDWQQSGFDVGLRASIPTLILPFSPWAKAGVVFYELENEQGSDRGTGYELGAGLAWSIFPKITLTPGVSYLTYTVDDEGSTDPDAEIDASQVRVDIGIRIRL